MERALGVVALSALTACTVDPLMLTGRECPCIAGWVCDEAANVCRPALDGRATDGGRRDGFTPPEDGGPDEDGGGTDGGGVDAGFDAGMDGGDPDAGPPCVPMAEVCDGDDDDCDDTIDEGGVCPTYTSCAAALAAGESANGGYFLDPDGAGAVRVYCDMTTDGGGWTLVASTQTVMLRDEASGWYADLATLAPASGNTGVWSALRGLATTFDVRFTCRSRVRMAGTPFDVDLSFYDVIWYGELTTGTDAECCFSEANGVGADPPPARRDNVAAIDLLAGDAWNTDAYLEGEDECDDTGDFTVDFDERGMDGDESDGTDWGQDDDLRKCGVNDLAVGQWFIFVRE